MKKLMNKIFLVVLAVMTFGCSDPDNSIYDVFDGMTHGAVIRTLNTGSLNFNLFDLASTWDITVETQDEEFGALLSQMVVYVSYTDNKDDGSDNNKSEVVLATVPASEFTPSANGLPSTDLLYTLADMVSGLGLAEGQYNGGDTFNFRLELHLTDGRTFSAADGSGSLQGSYFQSPYVYRAGMLCIPASPITGDYEIDMQDSYGDGWQGSAVVVTIDGASTSYSVADLYTSGLGGARNDPQYVANSVTVTVPEGTSTLLFEWVNGDYPSECTFQITTPSGATGIDAGPSPAAGEIALFLCDE